MSGTDWALLVLLSVLWGGSFFFSKIAVEGLPPLTLVFTRFAAASILLYAVLRATGQPIPTTLAAWRGFAGMGLLNNLVPAGLIVWGQTMIPSGLAAILVATTPIFSILATRLIGVDDRPTAGKAAGMALGIIGTAVLVGANGAGLSRPSAVGLGACLGAAISYGFANALGSRFRRLGIGPAVGAFGQMTMTSIMALPLALAIDHPWQLAVPGRSVLLAMIGLVVLSTALGYVIFFRILASAGATNISLVTLLIPVSAVLLGGAVLGETLSEFQLLGMALVGLGLVAIDGRAWRTFRRAGAPTQ
ncbi:MAG: EamA family transporter [Rhodospirillales bacterium]|nr:EamA family transporter [Rhodospirillales bacterium]MDE2199321.1 EamA family transporter [Rhodospirillales bacterium]MDE2576261.1 EamA family transporter [Rhodospirillales bacterium]